MPIELMPHQEEAVEAFRQKQGRMLLHADVGTGKTYIILECAKKLWEAHGSGEPVLILCPASLVKQWCEEARKYLGDDAFEIYRLSIINYEKLLNKEVMTQLLSEKWLMIAADECQRLSNHAAKSTRAFRKLRTRFKIAASATPFNNAMHELYSITDWLQPQVWSPSYWRFKNYECVTNFFGGIVGYKDEKSLRAKIAPLMHRIEKDVLIDLKPLDSYDITVDLYSEHKKEYEIVKKEYQIHSMGRDITIPNAVALISRLRQIVDCPQIFFSEITSSKMDILGELLINQEPTLVFVEHQETARVISERFGCPSITGNTPMSLRHDIVNAFQKGELPVVVGTFAMSTGLNMQRATRVVSYSQYWNPSRMDQAVGRAWRHGQEKTVEHATLVAKGTIDEKIARLIESKRQISSKFSREEILSLLR